MRLHPDPEESARLLRWRRWTDGPLLVVGIGSVPLLLLELIRNELTHADRVFLWVVNIVVATMFTVDYAVELRLAPHKPSFVRSEKIGAAIVISSLIALRAKTAEACTAGAGGFTTTSV